MLSAWLLGGAQRAGATQFVGGDLTYASLGSNQYRVTLHYYQDCSGVLPAPFTLTCRNGGCGAAAALTAPLVQQGAAEAGTPFCAAVSASPCQGPAGLPNYQLFTYAATVTLPAGQWLLSTVYAARPVMTSTAAGDLYVEATLDNRNASTGTAVANNSPRFALQDAPVQYVCRQQPTTLALPATEADGDSLAYELAAPLQACNVPVTYYPTSNMAVLAPIPGSSAPCFFSFPGVASGDVGGVYSPAYPIQLGMDTIGMCPARTGMLRQLRFNAQDHTISFTPGIYNAPTGNVSNNRYQMAMLVTEYRRINGVRRAIGTVRREMTVLVADCNDNYAPNPVTVFSQSVGCTFNNYPDTVRIDVRTCSYARVTLDVTDPDNRRTPSANQLLTVTLPADLGTNPQLLGGGDVGTFSLIGNGTTNPHGTFYFQPVPAAAGRTIYFNVRVDDNACPVRGVRNQVIAIRVLRSNLAVAAGANPGPLTVCAGNSLPLNSTVFRPDSVRNLATNTTLPQTFSYQWTTNPGGNGLPAVPTTRSISVSPTVTTRYFVGITPNTTFWAGACADTASVLVRVLPGPPAPTITRSGPVLTSSALAGNQWYRDNVLLPGATSRTLTVTTNGAYAATATVLTGASSCTSPLSAALTVLSAVHAAPGTRLSVVPNPTPDGRLLVTLTGYAQPVSLTVFDALGRQVAAGAVVAPIPLGAAQELNLSGCEAGLYLLQVRTATSLEIRRIVRQ